MENSKIKLVLASASPRRKELMGHLKIPFEVMAMNVPEESSAIDPVFYSLEIAQSKGKAVLEKLSLERSDENFLVVSADTIVCLGKKIFGKPKDRKEAKEFLSELKGQTHSVFTAVSATLLLNGCSKNFHFVEESRVTFNGMSEAILERYLDTGDSLDKAGAYGIQGPSLTFISKVEGDYANVVGFPLSRFVLECEKFFKIHFPHEELWLNLF
jgi:septum formation protein